MTQSIETGNGSADNRRLVFLTVNDFAKDGGGPVRMYGIVNALSRSGCPVTLISNASQSARFHHGVKHIHIGRRVSKRDKKIIQAMMSWLPHGIVCLAYRTLLSRLRECLPEDIGTLYSFEYLDNSLACLMKSRGYVSRYVNDTHGMAVLEFDARYRAAGNPLRKFVLLFKRLSARRLDAKVFGGAAGVIYGSRAMQDYFESNVIRRGPKSAAEGGSDGGADGAGGAAGGGAASGGSNVAAAGDSKTVGGGANVARGGSNIAGDSDGVAGGAVGGANVVAAGGGLNAIAAGGGKPDALIIPYVFGGNPDAHPDPESVKRLRNDLNIIDKDFVFLFAGSYKITSGVDNLIEAFGALHDGAPDTKLILIGSVGPLRERCRELAEGSRFAGSVTFIDAVPYSELINYQHIADVIVCPDRANSFSEYIVHTKYYDSLWSGKPVICGRFASTDRINPDDRLSVSFDPGDPDSLRRAMAHCMDNHAQLIEKYSGNRDYVMRNFTYTTFAERLAEWDNKLKRQ